MDLTHLIKMKAALAKNFHIQPSEIDRMQVWEYELFIKCINDEVTEENDRQQKEMDKYNIKNYQKMADPSKMSKMSQPQMPKMQMPSSVKF